MTTEEQQQIIDNPTPVWTLTGRKLDGCNPGMCELQFESKGVSQFRTCDIAEASHLVVGKRYYILPYDKVVG